MVISVPVKYTAVRSPYFDKTLQRIEKVKQYLFSPLRIVPNPLWCQFLPIPQVVVYHFWHSGGLLTKLEGEMTNKPAFYRVGNRLINRYEVRDVLIQEPQPFGYPRAVVTYKDGMKVKVAGSRVPMFITWIQDQDRPFGY